MGDFRKKLIFEITLTTVVVLSLAAGILFFGSNITASAVRIQNARTEVLSRWSSLNSLALLLGDYNNKAKEYMGVMEQAVPVQDQVFNLNREFRALATQGGVDAAYTFVEEQKPEAEALGAVRYQLNVSGDYDKVLRFMKSLENFRYLSTIDHTRVERGTPRSTMVVQGRVFFRD